MRPLLLALGVLACTSTPRPPPGAPGPEPLGPPGPAATSAPDPAAPTPPIEVPPPPTARPRVAREAVNDSCETDADCVVSSATGTCGPCGGCPQVLRAEEARRRDSAEAKCPKRRPDPRVHCSDCPVGPVASACVDRRCAPIFAAP